MTATLAVDAPLLHYVRFTDQVTEQQQKNTLNISTVKKNITRSLWTINDHGNVNKSVMLRDIRQAILTQH